MNCVAMIRTVTLPSGPDRRAQIVLGELARQMQRLGIDTLDVAGRVDVSGQGREHDHAERRGNEHADTERPQQFGAENSLLVHFGGSVGHGLAHRASRQEDQQIDRQIADHEQRDGGAGKNAGTEGYDPHDLGERGLIDLVSDFGLMISVRRLVRSVHRFAPASASNARASKKVTSGGGEFFLKGAAQCLALRID